MFNIQINIKYKSYPYFKEKLSIAVTENHELSRRKAVSFEDINGYNFLLRSELGFWDTLCREKMPASKFLVQNDDFEFDELVKNSSLPHFITDLVDDFQNNKYNRIFIPINDSEATVTFYVIVRDEKLYQSILKNISGCAQI